MEQTAMEGHFTYGRLIRFVLPCIFMVVVTSVYSIVDGFFVSNFAGKNAFAAVNLVMPVLMGCGAVGFMIGSGGITGIWLAVCAAEAVTLLLSFGLLLRFRNVYGYL